MIFQLEQKKLWIFWNVHLGIIIMIILLIETLFKGKR